MDGGEWYCLTVRVSEVVPMADGLAKAVGTVSDGPVCFTAEAATLSEAAEAIRNGGTVEMLVSRASLRFAYGGSDEA